MAVLVVQDRQLECLKVNRPFRKINADHYDSTGGTEKLTNIPDVRSFSPRND